MPVAARNSLSTLAALAVVLLARAASAEDAARCIAANNQGNDLRLKGKLLAARAELARCTTGCPKIIAEECAALVARVDGSIPSLVVSATDRSGRDVTPIEVYVDGQRMQAESGRAIALDPGEHEVRVIAADGRSTRVEIVALEGQKNRLLPVVLADAAGSEPASATSAQPTGPRAAAAAGRASGPPLAAWVVGGAGILALGSFGYFALSGKAQESDLERCAPRCADSDADALYRKYLVADISLGVGIVALGVATYLFVAETGKQESVAVRVVPARSGASVAARFAF